MHRTHSFVRVIVFGAAVLTTGACSASDPEEQSATSSTINAGPGLSWEEFRASAVQLPNGTLVVEGDLAFPDDASLQRYWQQSRAPRSGQELTVNRITVGGIEVDDTWTFPNGQRLTYCVGSGFSSNELNALGPALDEATKAWSRRAGVRFEQVTVSGTCDSSNDEVVFDVQNEVLGYFALSFFPSWARSSRTLFLDDTAFTTTSGGRTLTGVLTHELGHSIGFRHEHIWQNGTCSGESTDGARQVTGYDQVSVMHYPQCRTPPGGGYSVSDLDYSGAISLYGLAPALIVAASG